MNFYYISDPTQPLRPLGLVVMDAHSHSYTREGLLVQRLWGTVRLRHVWRRISPWGGLSWWLRLSRADPSPQQPPCAWEILRCPCRAASPQLWAIRKAQAPGSPLFGRACAPQGC